MGRYALLVMGLILLMSPAVNAQLMEFPVGGGSSKCIVRLGGSPEGVTIIPVGRLSYFSSEAEAQYSQISREILAPALIFVSMGMLSLFLLGLLLVGVFAFLCRVFAFTCRDS